MFIYPFKIVYLHSGQTRQILHDQLLKYTFLSDHGYRKPDANPRPFFGELSDQDFTLETIEKGDRLVNFITGDFRGSENEMYLRIQLGAWQHQRVFLLYAIATLACFVGFFVAVTNQIHIHAQAETPDIIHAILKALKPSLAYVFLICGISLSVALYTKATQFKKRLDRSIAFFSELWQATVIKKNRVPLLFQ
jgi:hypothetical protein